MEQTVQLTDENDNELEEKTVEIYHEKVRKSVNLLDKVRVDDVRSLVNKTASVDGCVSEVDNNVATGRRNCLLDNECIGGGNIGKGVNNVTIDEDDVEHFKGNDSEDGKCSDRTDQALEPNTADTGVLDSGRHSDTLSSFSDSRKLLNNNELDYKDEKEVPIIPKGSCAENLGGEDIKQEDYCVFGETEVKLETDDVNDHYIDNTEGINSSVAKKKRTKAPKTKLTMEQRLTCPICGKKFTNQSNRLAHEKMVHRNMRHNVCKVCGQGFYSSATLKKHMNKHTGERPYKCPICSKGFTQPGNATRHMESHSLVGNYECSVCKRVFKEKGNMKRHLETHSDIKPYPCTVCFKTFRTSSNRRRHEEMVHSGERNFFCDICSKSFSGADSTRLHMKIHTDERNFLCPKCGKRFIVKGALRRHMSVHDDDEVNKFQCGFCEKLFKTAKTLTSHMAIHTGNLTHFCHICNKGFANPSVLKKHVQTHSKERPHVCQICEKSFSSEHTLRRHFAIHGTDKPYGCELCDKRFLYSWYLKIHMNVHYGQRSHVCSVCEKGFSNKVSLKNHMSIHTGQKDYHCSLCDRSFREQGSFGRHKNSKIHRRREEKEQAMASSCEGK